MTVSSKFYEMLMFWSSNHWNHWRDTFIEAYSSNGILLVVETVSRNAFPVGKFLEYAEAPSETTNKWLKRSLSLKRRDNCVLVTDPCKSCPNIIQNYIDYIWFIIHLVTESCFLDVLHMFLFLNNASILNLWKLRDGTRCQHFPFFELRPRHGALRQNHPGRGCQTL